MRPRSVTSALVALKAARCPEDIFGAAPADWLNEYRSWAKLVHEDVVKVKDKAAAHEAFLLLTKWRDQAEAKMAASTYGDSKPSVLATLRTKTAAYDLVELIEAGDIADLYNGECAGKAILIKVCRNAANNDLMKTEADILAMLPAKLDPKHAVYFPSLLDSFEVPQGAAKVRVNVFGALPDGAVSLTAVRERYPDGIDPKDAAWMWNRMLEALHLLHVEGYIHANVTPDRFLIVPTTHQGILTDFCYARKVGQPAKAISPRWAGFYPSDLIGKKGLDTGVDLCLAAHCMNYLLGSSLTSVIPGKIPRAIAGLLKACWLGPAHRMTKAKILHADFRLVREGLGWKRGFRPFTL